MTEIKQAVIVAAGLSTRLRPITDTCSKCSLRIADEALIQRSVRLLKVAGVERILLVLGYDHVHIKSLAGTDVDTVLNPYYPLTNNMGSLWFAKDWLGSSPFLYLHGDLIYSENLLSTLLNSVLKDGGLLVDYGPTDEEAMKVIAKDGYLLESSKQLDAREAVGEWVGIAAFNQHKQLFAIIETLLLKGQYQSYDTAAFNQWVCEGAKINLIPTDGERWVEIDFAEDLTRAKEIFA